MFGNDIFVAYPLLSPYKLPPHHLSSRGRVPFLFLRGPPISFLWSIHFFLDELDKKIITPKKANMFGDVPLLITSNPEPNTPAWSFVASFVVVASNTGYVKTERT